MAKVGLDRIASCTKIRLAGTTDVLRKPKAHAYAARASFSLKPDKREQAVPRQLSANFGLVTSVRLLLR
jgi:hypothetical protein